MDAIKILEEVLKYTKKNCSSLSSEVGVNRQLLYDIQRGKTKSISYELANRICNVYPEISKEFLQSGQGNMLLQQHASTTSGSINQINGHNNNINSNNIGNVPTATYRTDGAPDEIKAITNALITSQAQTNMLIERLAIAQNQLLTAQANISELIELLKKK